MINQTSEFPFLLKIAKVVLRNFKLYISELARSGKRSGKMGPSGSAAFDQLDVMQIAIILITTTFVKIFFSGLHQLDLRFVAIHFGSHLLFARD